MLLDVLRTVGKHQESGANLPRCPPNGREIPGCVTPPCRRAGPPKSNQRRALARALRRVPCVSVRSVLWLCPFSSLSRCPLSRHWPLHAALTGVMIVVCPASRG